LTDQRFADALPDRISRLALAGRVLGVVAMALTVANCGSNSQQRAGIDPRYGVRPSPKMVADGQPVPKGGGYDKTGKPYVVAGRLYVPREDRNFSAVGLASWYGPSFHGRATANGEVFDRDSVTVAHPTLPLPSYVRVTNMLNGRSIIARVNDRGPYHSNRLVDVSERVASALNFRHLGTARVRVDFVDRAPLSGNDASMLMATLRTDGAPAQLNSFGSPVQVASTRSSTQPLGPIDRAVAPVKEIEASIEQAEPTSQRAPVVGIAAPHAPVPPDRPFFFGGVSVSGEAVAQRPMAQPVAAAPLAGPAALAPIPASASVAVPLPPARPQLAMLDATPVQYRLVAPVPAGLTPPARSVLR
jgi:rare lipoprotein A